MKLISFLILTLTLTSCVTNQNNDFQRLASNYKPSTTHFNSTKKQVNYKLKSRYNNGYESIANIKAKNIVSRESTNYQPISSRIDNDSIYKLDNPQSEIEYVDTFYDVNYDSEIDDSQKIDGQYIGHYKIGNSYEIFGITYQPQEFETFIEEGIASWYGPKFHGKKTANGEVYNMYELTAAHRVLPLPSIVKVTNLENNKNIIVRVNDRGPFAKDRVIDLSKKAAEILGFKGQGTTRVRVELMPQETHDLLKKLNLK